MSIQMLPYSHIIAIAETWRAMGGVPSVEIGALEPLLWRDGHYRIHDAVQALHERGFTISLTTNGQLLENYAVDLGRAGLSLLRISWHSMDPLMFKEMSGGHGDYRRFLRGITLALESGIPIAFNRVLHKGQCDDLPVQLEYIERYKSRLKLFTLLWTPGSAATYDAFYQDWRPIVRKHVLPRTMRIVRKQQTLGRPRLGFQLTAGGSVEVKLSDRLDRNAEPCRSCSYATTCEEEFGDYVRIDPRLHLYFCYMRRDVGFQILEYLGKPEALKQKMQEILGQEVTERFLTMSSLRLTVSPVCNFNCRSPGASQGWCLEEPGEYIYPVLRPSLLAR